MGDSFESHLGYLFEEVQLAPMQHGRRGGLALPPRLNSKIQNQADHGCNLGRRREIVALESEFLHQVDAKIAAKNQAEKVSARNATYTQNFE